MFAVIAGSCVKARRPCAVEPVTPHSFAIGRRLCGECWALVGAAWACLDGSCACKWVVLCGGTDRRVCARMCVLWWVWATGRLVGPRGGGSRGGDGGGGRGGKGSCIVRSWMQRRCKRVWLPSWHVFLGSSAFSEAVGDIPAAMWVGEKGVKGIQFVR